MAAGLGSGTGPSQPLIVLAGACIGSVHVQVMVKEEENLILVSKIILQRESNRVKHEMNCVEVGGGMGWRGPRHLRSSMWLTSRPPLFQVHDWEGAGHLPRDWG